jgi:hypothetical protein
MAREQGCVTEQNQRHTIDDAKTQLEPDVIFYFGFGPAVETDITIINPNAPSYVARSAQPVAGAALTTAEGRKDSKYEHSAYRRGRHFLPLAFETQGRASRHILTLLKRIAALTEPGIGLAVGDMMMDLQITLVRGNAECAQTVLARAAREEDRRRGGHYPISHSSHPLPDQPQLPERFSTCRSCSLLPLLHSFLSPQEPALRFDPDFNAIIGCSFN